MNIHATVRTIAFIGVDVRRGGRVYMECKYHVNVDSPLNDNRNPSGSTRGSGRQGI